MMFHRSELGQFVPLLPCDEKGYIPEPGDDWREMHWGLGEIDPCDPEIIEILDDLWWPEMTALAARIRERVHSMSGT